MKTSREFLSRYFRWFVPSTSALQSLFLLVIRIYWGWGFFQTGSGKLKNLERPAEFFQSLGIPFPHAQAMLVGLTETVGGLFLLAGFCSRLISLPLTVLLTVAYLTADLDRVQAIFSDPDKFVTADEFLFLYAVLLVLLFGPGRFSIDWLIKRKRSPGS